MINMDLWRNLDLRFITGQSTEEIQQEIINTANAHIKEPIDSLSEDKRDD